MYTKLCEHSRHFPDFWTACLCAERDRGFKLLEELSASITAGQRDNVQPACITSVQKFLEWTANLQSFGEQQVADASKQDKSFELFGPPMMHTTSCLELLVIFFCCLLCSTVEFFFRTICRCKPRQTQAKKALRDLMTILNKFNSGLDSQLYPDSLDTQITSLTGPADL
jgi:hypothetical protein